MESFLSTSIHNIFSWPISTFLCFSRIGKPVLDKGLLLSMKPTVQDGIYPLLLQNPRHSPLPFCAPLLQTSHALARMVNTSPRMINTTRSFQKTLESVGSF